MDKQQIKDILDNVGTDMEDSYEQMVTNCRYLLSEVERLEKENALLLDVKEAAEKFLDEACPNEHGDCFECTMGNTRGLKQALQAWEGRKG